MSAQREPAPRRLFTAAEAVASIALSHDVSCMCDACRAHDGDRAALARILAVLEGADAGAGRRGGPCESPTPAPHGGA